MHRMRCFVARAGLPFLIFALLAAGAPASAELIQSPGGRAYPDLAGSITGSQAYTYNAVTQTGTFQATNTPFLLSTGPTASHEAIVEPNADGTRTQELNLKLDQNGRLVSDPKNSYSLYGTVVLGGKTFQGLLLQATPTSFGSQGGTGAAFNLDLKVTGGQLAQTFGPDLYMELRPSLGSGFDGSFDKSFQTTIDYSNTLGYRAPAATAVPEPTTLVVLLAGGAWIWLARRRRILPRDVNSPG
jgi:hypothetical protein